jgi:hypothetical protein
MINKKMILALVMASLSTVSLLKLPLSIIFVAMLLGLLFIPPALVLASISIEGAAVIKKELHALLESGKEIFIISISKESIILEPNLNR